MCEFCSDPTGTTNRDQFHPSFAGFFSADAIDAAVRQANANRQSRLQPNRHRDDDDDEEEGGGDVDDGDSDGT